MLEENSKYIGKHILIVDDEDDILDTLEFKLGKMGFKVSKAHDGMNALRKVESDKSLDLVLTDVKMPGSIDGVGLLDGIREVFPNRPVVILISGYTDTKPETALEKGAVAFLKKPFSKNEFLNVIEKAVESCPELTGRDERIDINISTKLIKDGKKSQTLLHTQNLGLNGAFICMDNPLDEGEVAVFDFLIDTDTERDEVEIKGEVVWRRTRGRDNFPKGVGIKFLDLSEDLENKIKSIIKKSSN